MMQQYDAVKAHLESDVLLAFRLGDFLEFFGPDAMEASKLLGVTLTRRREVPMCGFPVHAKSTYLRMIVSAGRKVAVCEPTDKSPAAGRPVLTAICGLDAE